MNFVLQAEKKKLPEELIERNDEENMLDLPFNDPDLTEFIIPHFIGLKIQRDTILRSRRYHQL
jgi:hypothetical protein